jgi:hypothetical protein
MPCHQLIDHILALRCISEERANEFDQFLGVIVDESTFIKEVADVCQRCLLQGKSFKSIPNWLAEITYQEF